MRKVIGIDLGTVNSCVSVLIEGKPVIIADSEGQTTVPSVFAINSNQDALVGRKALLQAETNRLNTIFAVKRFIGRKFDSAEVQSAREKLPYKIVAAENNDAWVEINGMATSPEEVSARILEFLKKITEEFLQEEVTHAVITVPAHFNDAQRQATKDAGKIAGLKVLNIINEPTAAALAYGIDLEAKEETKERLIAVFDLGGGTFDITILGMQDGLFDVKSTGGNTFLGGEDFDLAIMNFLLAEFKKKEGIDLTEDKVALQRLNQAAKKAKHDLSQDPIAEIIIPAVSNNKKGLAPRELKTKIDRKQLELICKNLLTKLEVSCLNALADAKLSAQAIDEVILVGGMTKLPLIKKQCAKIFGKEPIDTVDPDSAVATGAAIQAGLMEGLLQGLSLADVSPLSLGVEVQGGKVVKLIPRNSKVPAKATEIFSTTSPDQTELSIHVLQGESEFAIENKSLGFFTMNDITPLPRGIPSIAITLEVDTDSIVNVSAVDLDTGEKKTIEILATSGLSDADLNRLVRENRQLKVETDRREQSENNRKQGPDLIEPIQDYPPEVTALKNDLKSLIFTTQFKLDTEGKYFRGEQRQNLELILIHSRKILEQAADLATLSQTFNSLKHTANILEEHLSLHPI